MDVTGRTLVVNRLHFPVTALGPGRRLGVWTQGCSVRCAGCLALDTWEPASGVSLPVEEFRELWGQALEQGADGLTVSGGEPGDQPRSLVSLLRAAREEATGRAADVLVYTGHPLAELIRRAPELIDEQLADAVISEPFRADAPTTLIWRGSANQTVTPITPLGHERYGPHLEHRPERAPMQLLASDHDAWLIGVPRQGELAALNKALSSAGFRNGQVSWRPGRRTGSAAGGRPEQAPQPLPDSSPAAPAGPTRKETDR
ncbi:4Fe-4S single cluster domain-containing protein [Streptomyces griseorubiginosus]|uniref:4Fe-4S single cluster domain-containing protein n=1 Tax=Streptomyces griseorubiginosus TaxID=67304 RepID=UPI0033AA922B